VTDSIPPSPAEEAPAKASAERGPVVLETVGLMKSFGGVKVIDDLSVQLFEGEALGIVGPNGAGKTTLFNMITGVYRPDGGRVVFAGKDITHAPRQNRCREGIGRTFQIPKPFSGMSVFENVLVCATYARGTRERASYQRCVETLELTRLTDKANRVAGKLTLLDRKRLELARALAGDPSVLLLDEIAGGLTEVEVEALIGTIRDLHAQGIAIVWIEHVVHALLATVDRIFAISFGRKLIEGDPEDVMCSDEVQACYMGGTPI
jgi:branched-chain amino acid transport system ATP-binding protein